MKIGILTLPLHENYGGILQAFALQKYLKERGHEVILINRGFNRRTKTVFSETIKRFLFPEKFKKNEENKRIKKNITHFINTYIQPKTEEINSYKSLKSKILNYNFDAVVVGSDQVWRTDYIKKMTSDYFLDFIKSKDVLKLSYAASFGTDLWQEEAQKTLKIKSFIKKFNGISVREDSGVNICTSVFDVKAEQHIDPTLLLSLQDYLNLIEKEDEPESDKNLLIYMLDINEDKQKVIDTVQKKIGGKTFSINKPAVSSTATIEQKTYPTVTNWLKGFFDAEFVITDSFHGTIFAILHNKPFIVYGNQQRGLTRFYSMLKKLKLENRILLKSADLTERILNHKIDWIYVNDQLNEERKSVHNFFTKFNI